MLRKIRIAVQTFCFSLFTVHVFAALTYPLHPNIPHDILFASNPLIGALTTIASRAANPPLIISAVIMSIIAILLGRIFCGFMCPLGALIDFSDKFFTSSVRHKTNSISNSWHAVKYVLLFAIFVLALFGILFPLFFDPLSMLTRIFTLVFYPLISLVMHDSYAAWGVIADNLKIETGLKTIAIPLYYGTALAAGTLLLILGAGALRPRFFCQYICPTGAFLGLIGCKPIFRRIADPAKCKQCSACSKSCPTGAISVTDHHVTKSSECIVCGKCSKKFGCSAFGFASYSSKQESLPDITRRKSIIGVGMGLLALPLFRATATKDGNGSGKIIRPPGAIPEEQFLRLCITCEACTKVCPTQAIQPASMFDGFNRINTPKIVPRIGGCEETCAACGHVCPTGALRGLPESEKPFVKIGTAVVDRHKCVAWAQNRECLVCDENCPYHAVKFSHQQTTKGVFKVPVVYEDLCVGCGRCEKACPVVDNAAIVVFNFGENRRSSGAYMSDEQKEKVKNRRKESGQDAMREGSSNTVQDVKETKSVLKEEGMESYGSESLKEGALPPGFQ